jgi:hypothetical protein
MAEFRRDLCCHTFVANTTDVWQHKCGMRKIDGGDCRAKGVIPILTRGESRNPRMKTEGRFCTQKLMVSHKKSKLPYCHFDQREKS